MIDPDDTIPIARQSTGVFKTGQWSCVRPRHIDKTSPCRAACPIGNDVPRALFAATHGDFDEALRIFLEENPLPGVCGCVCYHPCQASCNRKEWDGHVSIRALERFAAARGDAKPEIITNAGNQHHVAVVGSGPAGLSTAYHLARMGHPVTVFESEAEIGGALSQVIPKYRLPPRVLKADLDRLLSLDIQVRTRHKVERDKLLELIDNYSAVFVGLGAQKAQELDILDASFLNVSYGLEFLRAAKQGQLEEIGGRILIIGGGNVAVDAALTARRLGAEEVHVVCLEQPDEMRANESEHKDALEEGIVFHHGWGPSRAVNDGHHVETVAFHRCIGLFNAEGAFDPQFDESVTLRLDCDRVILSIGQQVDLSYIPQDLIDPSTSLLQFDRKTLGTSISGLWVGGDMTENPGSVVGALASGKRAALSIHLKLTSQSYDSMRETQLGSGPAFSIWNVFRPRVDWEPQSIVTFDKLEPLFLDSQPAVPIPRLLPEKRKDGFDPIEMALDEDRAVIEAGRCFYCGLCTACDRCFVFCPDMSLRAPLGEGRHYSIDDDYCKGCGICATVCPRGIVEMGMEE